MDIYSLKSLFTLRALWSGCCHVVVKTILTPGTVSTLSHCLSTSRRVESARGTGLRGDRSHWTVESLWTDVCVGILCRGGAVGPTGAVVAGLTDAHRQSQSLLVTVHPSRAALAVRGLGAVSLVVEGPGRTRVLVRVGCIQRTVVTSGAVGVIV